jgi:hypothetical protein
MLQFDLILELKKLITNLINYYFREKNLPFAICSMSVILISPFARHLFKRTSSLGEFFTRFIALIFFFHLLLRSLLAIFILNLGRRMKKKEIKVFSLEKFLHNFK